MSARFHFFVLVVIISQSVSPNNDLLDEKGSTVRSCLVSYVPHVSK